MLVGPLEAAAGVAARHPPQHVLAIDQARAIVGGQRVDLGVLKRRARHERIRRANVHAQVAVDAGAVVDEELVELTLLVLTDVVEHLDGPLRPAARHRASLLTQLADDALLLVEVQPAAERRRQQELLRRVLHGLLPAEQVHESDSHPLPDGDQGIADILKDPDHKLPSTGVEAVPGARSAGVPGTRVRVGGGTRRLAAPSARHASRITQFTPASARGDQPNATNSPVTRRLASVSGISTFQPNPMSWSIRTRGRVARSQNTTETRKNALAKKIAAGQSCAARSRRNGAGSRSSTAWPRAETPGIRERGLCQPPRNRR